jgi:hypothetical protein
LIIELATLLSAEQALIISLLVAIEEQSTQLASEFGSVVMGIYV